MATRSLCEGWAEPVPAFRERHIRLLLEISSHQPVMNKYLSAILPCTAAWFLSTSLFAQVAIPGGTEGRIDAIVDNGNGTATLTVMGMTCILPSTATINSPSKAMTLAEVVDPTPLPGRVEAGWIGGNRQGHWDCFGQRGHHV